MALKSNLLKLNNLFIETFHKQLIGQLFQALSI